MTVDLKIKQLEEHFVEHDAAHLVEKRPRACIRDGGAFTKNGRPCEGFYLVVLGASRAGRSRAIHRAFERISPRQTPPETGGRLFEVAVLSPITSGSLAVGIVAETGYETRGLSRMPVPEIWRFTHNLLHKMEADILLMEEAQNLANCTGMQPAAVGAALEARLQHHVWPISIVLSGDEQIDNILKADPHIRNRTRIVRFHPLSESGDLELLSETLADYPCIAGLEASPSVQTREFVERLMVASDRLFAFACDHMVKALAMALRAGMTSVTVHDVAEVVREREGCTDNSNVFLMDRFHGRQPDLPPETSPRRRRW